MTIEAKVVADSISLDGKRITTLQLKYPRFIHSEMMTHRVFSRNASSSRAIPVAKVIEQVRSDPAMPIHWGKNQAGMRAQEELKGQALRNVQVNWRAAALNAAMVAEQMAEDGAHKQIANRILEPFQWMHVVVTATEWDNFFELRCHPDAQPEMQALALAMRGAMGASTPNALKPGEWHLPYVTDEDVGVLIDAFQNNWIAFAKKISAARCCRVSYLKHDGHPSTIEEDLDLCEKLAGARPIHASPFEHQATPIHPIEFSDDLAAQGNFVGWIQFRKLIEASLR